MSDDLIERLEFCAKLHPQFGNPENGKLFAEAAAHIRELEAALREKAQGIGSFQERVQPWMMECFGPEISADKLERNHRFLEEALELVQANGCTQHEAHQLVDYVYGRDEGEINQEIGGVMVTLAALCLAVGEDMHVAGEKELARVWTKVEKIRAKQAAKPKHLPLPQAALTPAPVSVDDGVAAIAAERQRQMDVEGWTPEHDDKHIRGEMGAVAACYAVPSRDRLFALDQFWPPTWDYSWWKPSGAHDDLTARRRDLVKAGALIAAEIDRLDRAALRTLAGGE